MSQDDNPFSSPAPGAQGARPRPPIMATAEALQHVVSTGPWARFISVLMLLTTAAMVCGGAVMMFAAMADGEGLGVAGVGVAYGLLAVLYLLPSLALFRFASAAGRLRDAVEGQDPMGAFALEAALDQMRRFWRIVGIMMAAILGLYALILGLAILAGLLGALS